MCSMAIREPTGPTSIYPIIEKFVNDEYKNGSIALAVDQQKGMQE
jgi:hypothetical protein